MFFCGRVNIVDCPFYGLCFMVGHMIVDACYIYSKTLHNYYSNGVRYENNKPNDVMKITSPLNVENQFSSAC
jgi:hypothetical protein